MNIIKKTRAHLLCCVASTLNISICKEECGGRLSPSPLLDNMLALTIKLHTTTATVAADDDDVQYEPTFFKEFL